MNRSDSQPGIVIDIDGAMLYTNQANIARVDANRTARDIAEIIESDLSAIVVVLDDLPEAHEDVDGATDWLYETLTVTVHTITDPSEAPDNLEVVVRDRFTRRITSPNRTRSERLQVVLTTTAPPTIAPEGGAMSTTRMEIATTPVENPAPNDDQSANTEPAPSAPTSERSYRILEGDTLADISMAFYGTPQHWRAIVTANPGLDPAALTPGQVITIPVLADQ